MPTSQCGDARLLLTERDRLAGFFGNCVLGARWDRLGWARTPMSSRPRCRRGILCRGGLRRRLLVPSNLPSGLLNGRQKLASREAASDARLSCTRSDESPVRDVWRARTGGSHRYFQLRFPSTSEGRVPVKGKTRSHLNFESRPCVYSSSPPAKGGLKSTLGMLNVLPYMVPVQRETP